MLKCNEICNRSDKIFVKLTKGIIKQACGETKTMHTIFKHVLVSRHAYSLRFLCTAAGQFRAAETHLILFIIVFELWFRILYGSRESYHKNGVYALKEK